MDARRSKPSVGPSGGAGLFSFLTLVLISGVLVVGVQCVPQGHDSKPPPINLDGGTRGDVGRVIRETDALVGRERDAVVEPDTQVSLPDVRQPDPEDAGMEEPDTMKPDEICDLIDQDCPAGRGCYPADNGKTICLEPGIEQGDCTESDNCDRGMICAGAEALGEPYFCVPLCHPTRKPCLGMAPCVPLPFREIGFCDF